MNLGVSVVVARPAFFLKLCPKVKSDGLHAFWSGSCCPDSANYMVMTSGNVVMEHSDLHDATTYHIFRL